MKMFWVSYQGHFRMQIPVEKLKPILVTRDTYKNPPCNIYDEEGTLLPYTALRGSILSIAHRTNRVYEYYYRIAEKLGKMAANKLNKTNEKLITIKCKTDILTDTHHKPKESIKNILRVSFFKKREDYENREMKVFYQGGVYYFYNIKGLPPQKIWALHDLTMELRKCDNAINK